MVAATADLCGVRGIAPHGYKMEIQFETPLDYILCADWMESESRKQV
jgi:hypothetical protein